MYLVHCDFVTDGRQGFIGCLDKERLALQQRAFAAGTNHNRACQIRAYLLFCVYAEVDYLPITDINLARYVALLARSFKSYQTVINYIDGVRFYHALCGFPFDVKNAFVVKTTLRGVRRQLGDHLVQKLPVTPAVLLDIYKVMDQHNPAHVVVWAAFLIAFYGFLRKSNVVPSSARLFDPQLHLTRQSFAISSNKINVTILKTKTVQFGQRQLDIPLVHVPGSPLCPVAALTRMFKLVPAPVAAPAFVIPIQGQFFTLTHASFVNYLRYFLQLAGYPAHRYTGHSFRMGGCSFAATCNVPEHLIKFHGDWHSDAFERYLHLPSETRCQVTKLMSESLRTKSC